MKTKKILIVDDDTGHCDNFEDILRLEGYTPFSATTCAKAIELVREKQPHAALLDLKLPDGSGTMLLSEIKAIHPECYCIILTAHADLDSAVASLRKGAFQYLQKPLRPEKFLRILEHIFETIDLQEKERTTAAQKRKLEVQLQEAQKMKAISSLAGGVAHQFNNALSAITGNIELIKMTLPENLGIEKYSNQIDEAVRRMVYLTNQLLAYAQEGKYFAKRISLNHFIKDTLPLIQHEVGASIRVEEILSAEILNVDVDPVQMQMVLSALLTNSAEAIKGEGRIKIITRAVKADEICKKMPRLVAGKEAYVCLMVEDDGSGMEEETQRRIFEPFFTTNFHGRGLGMAAVFGIIKNHSGYIFVDSVPGKGTTVSIYLPASAATPPSA